MHEIEIREPGGRIIAPAGYKGKSLTPAEVQRRFAQAVERVRRGRRIGRTRKSGEAYEVDLREKGDEMNRTPYRANSDTPLYLKYLNGCGTPVHTRPPLPSVEESNARLHESLQRLGAAPRPEDELPERASRQHNLADAFERIFAHRPDGKRLAEAALKERRQW